jgi:hypothetical protein
MVNEEFKLKFYFNIYKDYPIGSRDNFRIEFRRRHGNFKYMPELILMIEKYQKEKYGTTIWKDKHLYAPGKRRK